MISIKATKNRILFTMQIAVLTICSLLNFLAALHFNYASCTPVNTEPMLFIVVIASGLSILTLLISSVLAFMFGLPLILLLFLLSLKMSFFPLKGPEKANDFLESLGIENFVEGENLSLVNTIMKALRSRNFQKTLMFVIIILFSAILLSLEIELYPY